MTSVTALTLAAFFCYLICAMLLGSAIVLRAMQDGKRRFGLRVGGRVLLLLGIAAQFAATGALCIATRRSPFASVYGSISITAWFAAIAVLAMDMRARFVAVDAVASTIASLLVLWSAMHLGDQPGVATVLQTGIVTAHVLCITVSVGLLAVAAGSAALYLVQHRLLRRHENPTLLGALPPLETLDSIGYHAVSAALPMLTLGLILGFTRMYQGGTLTFSHTLPDGKVLLSMAVWLLYIGYLGMRIVAGWRGVRLQYVLVAGLLVSLAVYAAPSAAHRIG